MTMSDVSNETISILLAGVGGQGSLLASVIVSQAALNAGYQVKTNEVHGMAQRGGSVVTQIRYGREVFSPLIPDGTASVLGAFEMCESLRHAHYLMPGGLAVVASQKIIPVSVSSGGKTYPTDIDERLKRVFTRLTLLDAEGIAAGLGNRRTANTVVLGALSHGLNLPVDAWRVAIETAVKPSFRTVNLKAFDAGRRESC